ncbi:hypothetical protein BGW80DRAFT_1257945 [Lactifluus volemus]|nr:hypothetical protein BGW80DRAFT_1257945 [Lactifluus volemus]
MTLPQAELALNNHLGDRYKDIDWRPALNAVMDAEGDVQKAQKAIQRLSAACGRPKITIKLPAMAGARPPQLVAAEDNLVDSVKVLQSRNRIFGQPLTVDELINPVQEQEILGESPYAFPGGDVEIVKQVTHEQRVEQGDVVEVDSDDDDGGNNPTGSLSRHEAIDLIAKLEPLVINHGNNASNSLKLANLLRQFRAHLHREDALNSKQTTLDTFFKATVE